MGVEGLAVLLYKCYRPPSMVVKFWDSSQCQLDQAKRGSVRNILISGDLDTDVTTAVGHYPMSFFQENHLSVHVNQPTRLTAVSFTYLDYIVFSIPWPLNRRMLHHIFVSSQHNSVLTLKNVNVIKGKCCIIKNWSISAQNSLDAIATAVSLAAIAIRSARNGDC